MCPSSFQVRKFPDPNSTYFKVMRTISFCSVRGTCLEYKCLGDLSGERNFFGKKKDYHSIQLSVQKAQHPRRAFYHCCSFITHYLTTKLFAPTSGEEMGTPSNAWNQALQISVFQLGFSRKLEVTDLGEEEFSELQLQIYLFYVTVITDNKVPYNI